VATDEKHIENHYHTTCTKIQFGINFCCAKVLHKYGYNLIKIRTYFIICPFYFAITAIMLDTQSDTYTRRENSSSPTSSAARNDSSKENITKMGVLIENSPN